MRLLIHFARAYPGRSLLTLLALLLAGLLDGVGLSSLLAMLVSVASYPLWLHWRPVGEWLARQFLDYEPGIHYSQFQMQSGVTGINAIRIYSPAKQAVDQDPKGHFIRRWVPELKDVPTDYLAEPHKMPEPLQMATNCIIGKDYKWQGSRPSTRGHGTFRCRHYRASICH